MNIFNKYCVIMLAIPLSGCMNEVSRHDIDKASSVCGKYENILTIKVFDKDSKYVLCYQNEKEVRIGGTK